MTNDPRRKRDDAEAVATTISRLQQDLAVLQAKDEHLAYTLAGVMRRRAEKQRRLADIRIALAVYKRYLNEEAL